MVYGKYDENEICHQGLLSVQLLLMITTMIPLIAGTLISVMLSFEVLVVFILLEGFNLTLNWYRGKQSLDYYLEFFALLLIGILVGATISALYHIEPLITM